MFRMTSRAGRKPGARSLLLAAAMLAAGVVSAAHAASVGTPFTLTLGGTFSVATAINGNGWVCGYADTPTSPSRAFLYNGTATKDLGTLVPAGSANSATATSEATAISPSGVVLGLADTGPVDSSGTTLYDPFVYDSAGIHHLWLNGYFSQAVQMNALGQVCGYGQTAAGDGHAWMWDGSKVIDLGAAWGSNYSEASSITDTGTVLGFHQVFDTASGNWYNQAFIYTPAGVRNLTLGGIYSVVNAVNPNGIAIGQSTTATDPNPGHAHAFVSNGASVIDINPTGAVSSNATLINATGTVVGTYVTSIGGTRTFVYTPSTGARDIGTLGGNFAVPLKLTDAGQILGRSTKAGVGDDANSFFVQSQYGRSGHAFLYSGGVLQDLGTLGGVYSEPWDMGPDGTIIGDSTNVAGVIHGFSWKNGVISDLYVNIANESHTSQVNAQGLVLGYAIVVGYPGADQVIYEAFVKDGAGVHELTLGGVGSTAWSMNDNGVVIGDAQLPGGNTAAFVWDSNGILNVGPAGSIYSTARLLNASNQFTVSGAGAFAVVLKDTPTTPQGGGAGGTGSTGGSTGTLGGFVTGAYYTYTKGGWQGGGVPGQLFQTKYVAAFPYGLTLGASLPGGGLHSALWEGTATGQAALRTYLTSSAKGTSGPFTTDYKNATSTVGGDLPRQMAAFGISLGISGLQGGTPAGLGKLIYHNPGDSLDGLSLSQLFAAINQSLGNGKAPRGHTFQDLNVLVTNINQGFDNGIPTAWAQQHLGR